jgi:hypothetical protein
MLKTFCCLLITTSVALAQSKAPLQIAMATPARVGVQGSAPRSEIFRKEYLALQKSVDAAIGEVPGVQILQTAKATYLEEFGIVIVLEVSLEPPRNPFDLGNPNLGRSLAEKQKLVRAKVQQFLTQKAPMIQSLNPEDSLVVSVHIFNANPVDARNLPGQIVFKVKKQDSSQVIVREL